MGKNNKQKNPMSNPATMGREGMRIMRDIAHGNYNIYAEGHVFRNLEFVKAVINEVAPFVPTIEFEVNEVEEWPTDDNVTIG